MLLSIDSIGCHEHDPAVASGRRGKDEEASYPMTVTLLFERESSPDASEEAIFEGFMIASLISRIVINDGERNGAASRYGARKHLTHAAQIRCVRVDSYEGPESASPLSLRKTTEIRRPPSSRQLPKQPSPISRDQNSRSRTFRRCRSASEDREGLLVGSALPLPEARRT